MLSILAYRNLIKSRNQLITSARCYLISRSNATNKIKNDQLLLKHQLIKSKEYKLSSFNNSNRLLKGPTILAYNNLHRLFKINSSSHQNACNHYHDFRRKVKSVF